MECDSVPFLAARPPYMCSATSWHIYTDVQETLLLIPMEMGQHYGMLLKLISSLSYHIQTDGKARNKPKCGGALYMVV